jgi:hypothetical protein
LPKKKKGRGKYSKIKNKRGNKFSGFCGAKNGT